MINDVINVEFDELDTHMSIAKAMTQDYSSIFIIDPETERLYLYKSNMKYKKLVKVAKDYPNYTEAMKNYINDYVHVDDQERLIRELKLFNIKFFLDKNDVFTCSYKRVFENKLDYALFYYAYVNISNKKYIVQAVRNVNKEHENALRQKRMLQKALEYRTQYDTLTNLYNKEEFIRKTRERIDNSSSTDHFYMIRFDIDRFSLFNTFFGIIEGDNLLKYTASTLVELGQKYDIIYSRSSADIFNILLTGYLPDLEGFLKELSASLKHFTNYYDIQISAGVYEIIDYAISIEKMIDYCKLSSKEIKNSFDKSFAIYKEELNKKRVDEQNIINNMNSALENKEFCIFLQPKFNIETNELIGAESLVRWKRDGKIIPPGMFIPIFEKNGFIIKLDYYVWEETCKYLKWRMDNNLKLFPISVNVSRVFFSLNSFVDYIKGLVEKYNIDPKYLELEITENVLVDVDLIKEKVAALREYGFKILMDDFGSGYSSLNVLKDVDFDVIKIDLRFFTKESEKSLKIIESVINLAKSLDIPSIAEGVETQKYIDLLKKFGCHYAQGYFYSKPIEVDEFNQKYR